MKRSENDKDFTLESWKALAVAILALVAFIIFLWAVIAVIALLATVKF